MEYLLELWTPEIMKLLGSTKSKIAKDENGQTCVSFRNYWDSIKTL